MPSLQLLDLFNDLLVQVSHRWKLHEDLFQDAENTDIFNHSSPLVWMLLEEGFLDAIMMEVGRLMDPKETFNQTNLSLDFMLHEFGPFMSGSPVEQLASSAKARFEKHLKPWRNKFLGHNDLARMEGKFTLPTVPYAEIGNLIKEIAQIASLISVAHRGQSVSFDLGVPPGKWVPRLKRILREGASG